MTNPTQKIRAALEISIGYTGLVANGIGNMPILKDRAKDDCRILSEAMDVLDQIENPWQPIETAPASNEVLVLIGIDIFSAYQNTLGQWVAQDPSGGGQCFLYGKPTHWMPLPQPPQVKE